MGGRNHYLQFDLLKTPKSLSSAGLSYDSSMGFNFSNGFRVGTSFPYQWESIIEMPLHIMDTSLWYECETNQERFNRITEIQQRVKNNGGLLMLNWHLQYVNQEKFSERFKLFKGILERAIADKAWICLPREVFQVWRDRIHLSRGQSRDS